MAAGGSPVPRIPLSDLIPADGSPSDTYKHSTALLFQSLQKFSFAILQLPSSDAALLRCALDSARMFFHHRPLPTPDSAHTLDHAAHNWHRTAGYYSEPQFIRELYDYRPGTAGGTADGTELQPTGLPELFTTLGRAARYVLEAIAWTLELRSFSFTDFLDNVPLKNGELSSSVLSVTCQGRPGLDVPVYDGHEHHHHHADKGLVTLVKSDKHGLEIRDLHGRWQLADGGLGPHEVVLFCGLSLHQATGGSVTPAYFRTEAGACSQMSMFGRCSVAFRLMPKATGLLHCLTTAGSSPFQQPVTVHDFMQRSHTIDQLISRHAVPSFAFSPQQQPEGPMKSLKRRKQVTRGKPLAPSKRLRLEAQRVLKERVQEIAEGKNMKIRFCNFKECDENHLTSLDSPCSHLRAELGWPHGVPFVHPHDLPNKAKQAFLEAYEPGWTASQDVELGLIESTHLHHHH